MKYTVKLIAIRCTRCSKEPLVAGHAYVQETNEVIEQSINAAVVNSILKKHIERKCTGAIRLTTIDGASGVGK